MEVEPEVWVQKKYGSFEHEAFIKDILADPSDDVRRLVFADFLEERGEADFAEELRKGPLLVWKTADGTVCPIRYLNTQHLNNILANYVGSVSNRLRKALIAERERRQEHGL